MNIQTVKFVSTWIWDNLTSKMKYDQIYWIVNVIFNQENQ